MRFHFVFILLSCIAGQVYADSNSTIKAFSINTPLHPPATTKKHDGFEDLLAMELFSRLGFKPEIHIVPAERGLINLNQGIDDAILTRGAGLEKIYPNIVRITEVANERKYIAFARKDIKLNSWDDLEKYDVAHINGWKIFDRNVKKYKSSIKVRGPEQLFYLLDKDRVDVVLYGLSAGQWMIRKLEIKNVRPIYPPLANKQKFFYLNKKHAALIPRANEVLRQIKQDGTYAKLRQQTQ
ncbi:MAG: transporter substrate-binding domain-containing protein [Desulfobacterales bacterium]|nr:MAG: transporter substrate-binding domain-containing protein [Desulfobacterales bacterium]